MSMRALEKIRRMACDELDEIAEKDELTGGTLEIAHRLTDTIKNIDKICIMGESEGYSQAGDWEMEGRGSYGRGNSYASRGSHYVRGHYSRDDGYSQRRDSMGRYSRDDARQSMIDQLGTMMETAGGDREREAIRRCMERLEKG